MKVKLSIILPAYNVEKYISKAIESALSQTYLNFELIVVIDGSPDNSKKIAESYAKNDSRIKVFEKENGGLSDARNYGMEKATGEYIYFMDSDDWIEPNLLDDTVQILDQENLDLVIFGYYQDNESFNGELESSQNIKPGENTFTKQDGNLKLDDHLVGLLGYAWNKVYRKEFLDKYQLKFDKGISLVEDILFNSRVYCKTNTIRTLDKAYYHYINRPVQTLIKQFHSDSFDLKLAKAKALERFMDLWNVSEVKKQELLAYSLIQGIRYCVHNLFAFKNNFRFSQKLQYVKRMLNHSETIRLIPFYKSSSFASRIYAWSIRHKMYRTIAFSARMIK